MAWSDFFKLWWYAFMTPPAEHGGGVTSGDWDLRSVPDVVAVPEEDELRKSWHIGKSADLESQSPRKGRAGSTPASSASDDESEKQ